MYYINKTYLYSKKNIAGFEILDNEDKDFRELLHVDEAIEFIKNKGGKIYNATLYKKKKDKFDRVIYDIKADGENLKDLKEKQNKLQTLEVEKRVNQNSKKIEKDASKKLDMIYPAEYQKKYIFFPCYFSPLNCILYNLA